MGFGQPRPAGGFELYTWLFMRVSGLLLVFLAIGHLAIMHLINSVEVVSYAFVAERFTTFFWRGYDLLMLYLAMLHGTNGIRTIIDDYVHGKISHKLSLGFLYLLSTIFLVLGTIVLVSFKPPIAP